MFRLSTTHQYINTESISDVYNTDRIHRHIANRIPKGDIWMWTQMFLCEFVCYTPIATSHLICKHWSIHVGTAIFLACVCVWTFSVVMPNVSKYSQVIKIPSIDSTLFNTLFCSRIFTRFFFVVWNNELSK